MEAFKDYLLSVTAAALICGIVSSLAGKNSGISKLVKLLCGLFLAATVIKPLVDVRIENIYDFTDSLTDGSDLAVSQGENMASEEMKRIIKQKTETYILDKAKALGLDITVDVTLEDYVPVSVTITGDVAPYAKTDLGASIAQELDIPLEDQIWIRS